MRVLIIEDEHLAAQRLQKLIKEIRPEAVVVGVLDSVETSIEWIEAHRDHPPDIAFLDIQLADGTSFEILAQTSPNCPIIFTTAYDQYALEAFKVHAVDYLLKPIKKDALTESISRIINQKQSQNMLADLVSEFNKSKQQKRFVIRIGKHIKLVNIDSIAFFHTEHKLTYLTTFDHKHYPIDQSLDQLQEQLDPQVFFRANRQFILNIHAISEMYSYSKARVKVTTQPSATTDIIVSTEKSSKFKKWLAGG